MPLLTIRWPAWMRTLGQCYATAWSSKYNCAVVRQIVRFWPVLPVTLMRCRSAVGQISVPCSVVSMRASRLLCPVGERSPSGFFGAAGASPALCSIDPALDCSRSRFLRAGRSACRLQLEFLLSQRSGGMFSAYALAHVGFSVSQTWQQRIARPVDRKGTQEGTIPGRFDALRVQSGRIEHPSRSSKLL